MANNVSNIKVGSTTYYITDTTSGYVTENHEHSAADITSGTLPASRGGTGQTTLAKAASSLLGSLSEATSSIGSTAYIITNGASDAYTTTFYKRPASAVINSSVVKSALGTTTTTENKYLRDDGTWVTPTDTKVIQYPSSNAAFRPILAKETSTSTQATEGTAFTTYVQMKPSTGMISTNGPGSSGSANATGFRIMDSANSNAVGALMKYREGTAETTGIALLTLGNSVVEGTAGNAHAVVTLHNDNTGYNEIASGATSTNKRTNYIADANGWIAVGGNKTTPSGEGSVSVPIYMGTNGELMPVTSINSSLITLSKAQVTGALGFTPPETNTDTYPTALSWTAGSTAGPKPSVSRAGTTTTAITGDAIPSAGASASGIITTGAQTLAGTKTFNGGITSASTTTLNGILVGKSGAVTVGNYTTTNPNGTTGTTGQIMFVLMS